MWSVRPVTVTTRNLSRKQTYLAFNNLGLSRDVAVLLLSPRYWLFAFVGPYFTIPDPTAPLPESWIINAMSSHESYRLQSLAIDDISPHEISFNQGTGAIPNRGPLCFKRS